MLAQGIKTGADLKKLSQAALIKRYGKNGTYYYNIAHGRDDRPVRPDRERKSLGKETTLAEDITDRLQIRAVLENLADQVGALLQKQPAFGRTLTLKVKYFDFKTITRSITLAEPIRGPAVIREQVPRLLEKTEAGKRKIRLLGITVSNFMGRGNNDKGGSPGKQMKLLI
jgi:DNA polymerase-4